MTAATDDDPRYRAALAALASRGRFGIRLGLGRTRALLRALGDPHVGLRGVLIGGTNGKGSVQALVAAALLEAGYSIGQTPKPHLVSYRERVVVDGTPIARGELAALVEEVLDHAARVERRLGPPTEFEVLTAAAFTWFRRRDVDLGVVEVGLGGRLDATNVWQGGVSAITNVALDHTEHLGPTVGHIAREKARIVKRGDAAAVTGADGEPLAIIRRRAQRQGVPVRVAAPLAVVGMDRRGLITSTHDGRPLRVGLLGRHQAANSSMALAILDEMAAAGMAAVPEQALRRAFESAHWPGRLELLALTGAGSARPARPDAAHPSEPDVILDGAHNPHGAEALASALDELRPLLSAGRPTVLMAALADKDVDAMVGPLAASAALRDARVVATAVPGSPRTLPAGDLADAWRAVRDAAGTGRDGTDGRSIVAVDDPAMALGRAVDEALAAGGPLVVCGSLYLVGFVRGRLVADGPSVDPA